MTNNEVLKKLRIALELRDTDILEILQLADFQISKGALGDLFRSEDHENFVEAGDQILRNFLNGLIIYKRGPEMKREGSTPKSVKPQKNIVPKILLKDKGHFERRDFNKPSQENESLNLHSEKNKNTKSSNIDNNPKDSSMKETRSKDAKSIFNKDYFSKKL